MEDGAGMMGPGMAGGMNQGMGGDVGNNPSAAYNYNAWYQVGGAELFHCSITLCLTSTLFSEQWLCCLFGPAPCIWYGSISPTTSPVKPHTLFLGKQGKKMFPAL